VGHARAAHRTSAIRDFRAARSHRRRYRRSDMRLCEPISSGHRTGLRRAETEIGKLRAETGALNSPPKNRNARNCRPETEAHRPNPRRYRRFSPTGKNQPRIFNSSAALERSPLTAAAASLLTFNSIREAFFLLLRSRNSTSLFNTVSSHPAAGLWRPYTLIEPIQSLFRVQISLFGRKPFPVRRHREFRRNTRNLLNLLAAICG
jgi:hypothetical protein